MTLKHISFHESEVMRSLERIAVKQGHFDPTSEELLTSAVYKMKAAKQVQPTDNVMSDLLTLASLLRERGYEKQASELESKLGLYKTAETHLYRVHDEDGEDVLNFAHPETAVQMDDRGSPFGKVFSPTEKARIMREVVKKEPSGKLAVAAAMLKKNAQEDVDAESPAELEVAPEDVAVPEEFDAKTDPKTKATTAIVKDVVSKIKFTADASKINFVPYEKEIFSSERSVISDLFIQKANVKKQDINVLIQAYNFFYAGKVVNANTIFGNLPSLVSNKDAVINFARQVGADVSQEINAYVTEPSMWAKTPSIAGSTLITSLLGGPVIGLMTGTMATGVIQGAKDKLLRSAALKIYQGLSATYNSLISSRLAPATESLQKDFNTALVAINRASATLAGTSFEMKGGEINFESVLNSVNNANKIYIDAVKKYGHTISKVLAAFDPERATAFGSFVENVPVVFSNALVKISKNTAHATVVSFPTESLDAAAKYWENKVEVLRGLEKTEDAAAARRNFVEITSIKNILTKYSNKPFVLIAAALNRSKLVPAEKLVSVQTLNDYIKYLTSISVDKTASLKKNNLTKLALEPVPGSNVPGSPPLKGGPAQTSAQTPARGGDTGAAYQTPSKYPSGVHGRPTVEEREKVRRMQSALNYFSNSIKEDQDKLIKDLGVTAEDINKWAQSLISTGGQYSFDGKWASKTSNALKTINEIIARAKAKDIYKGDSVVAPHNYQSDGAVDIMRDADANVNKIAVLANALRVGHKYFGKKDEVDNTVLDMVPSELMDDNFNKVDGKYPIPVRESNLASLYNFHYFLNHYYPDMSTLKRASTQDKLKKLARHIVSTDIVREAQDHNIWMDPAKVDEMIARPNYNPDPMATGLNLPGKGHQFDSVRNPKRVHNDDRKIVEYNKPQQSAPAAQQKPVQQAPGLNINELEAALQWFWKRSNAVLFAAQNPKEIVDEQVDRTKLAKAQMYVAYMKRLYQQFYAWKTKGEPSISTLPGGPEERGEAGASMPKPGGRGGVGAEGYEAQTGDAEDLIGKLRRPPLRDLINLESLAQEYNVRISSYAYAFQHSWLDINTLRGAYAPNIYNELIKKTTQEYWRRLADQESYQAGQQGKNGTNVYAYLKQTLNAVSLTLSEIFSNWSNKVMKSDQPRDAVEKIIRQQKGKLNEWISVIQRVNDDIDNLISYNRGRFGLK